MARSLNKVMLIGHLGADPALRELDNGTPVCNFRVATSESWKDKDSGDRKERTEWHSVVVFGKLAEIANDYAHKGTLVYLEGSLRTRKWSDKNGHDRYSTEIVASELQVLTPRDKSQAGGQEPDAEDEGVDESAAA